MKRFIVFFIVLFLIVALFPFVSAYGYGLAVFDAGLNTLMYGSVIEQAIHYAQIIAHHTQQAMQTYAMVQNLVHQTQMATQNLRTIGDISSWSDFMDFYNRQLYMERRVMETWDNTNVRIGNSTFHIADLESIAHGYRSQTVDYWAQNELTPQQRRAMWLQMGLTPSNYAFVQPFRARAMELTREGLTGAQIQNEWYTRQMQRNAERLRRLAEDHTLAEEYQLGSKEIAMYTLETILAMEKVINDLAMQLAALNERMAVQDMLDQTPTSYNPMGVWSDRMFTPLVP